MINILVKRIKKNLVKEYQLILFNYYLFIFNKLKNLKKL